MSLQMQKRLRNLKDELVKAYENSYHYHAPSDVKAPYMVWKEEGEYNSSNNDNHKTEQSIYGFVEYFTDVEFDPATDRIQEALNGLENCAWQLSSVQYGDPTSEDDNLIHYTWEWRTW